RFDFAEMGEERRQKLVGPSHQTARALVQLVVGDVIEAVGRSRGVGVHARSVHAQISGPRLARSGVFSGKNEFRVARAKKTFSRAANGLANDVQTLPSRRGDAVFRKSCPERSYLARSLLELGAELRAREKIAEGGCGHCAGLSM